MNDSHLNAKVMNFYYRIIVSSKLRLKHNQLSSAPCLVTKCPIIFVSLCQIKNSRDMSAILYIHFKTLFKIIYLNCFKHFSWRRLLATVVIVLVMVIICMFLLMFRLMDEILFFRYRKTKIEAPVFIVSNPRSGTTFMHRLLCMDEERYAYMLLYHTIIPSVTFYKIVRGISVVDKRIGRPFRRLFDWIDGWLFKGWRGIHLTGFNKTEEDEGLYIFSFLSIAVCLLCPFMQHFEYLTIIDEMPEKTRRKLQKYYRSSLQRFMYSEGKGKILLNKNVITTGRLHTILDMFPDARIVYLIRDPESAVPSFISMFSATWKFIAPEIPENSEEYRALGQIPIGFYNYFHKNKDNFKAENFLTIPYAELTAAPVQAVEKVYAHFNMPLSEVFEKRLKNALKNTPAYRSKHEYSLAQYGFTKQDIEEQLSEVMSEYGFL